MSITYNWSLTPNIDKRPERSEQAKQLHMTNKKQ
jgi:hypothetical protein